MMADTRPMEKNSNKTIIAYDEIERQIIFQELQPGAMVSEKELADRLSLGRTPVREALQRLSYERMVHIHPRRGVQIAPLSVESQLKVLEVRRGVEAMCVRFAVMRADFAAKQKMLSIANDLEQCARDDDDIRFADYLKRTHLLLAEAAKNEYMQVAMAPLQGLSRRFWFAYKDDFSDLARGAELHVAVLHAISHTDMETAVEASYKLNDYLTEFAYNVIRVHG